MNAQILGWHESLGAASRLQPRNVWRVSSVSLTETGILLGCGIAAAVAVLLLDFRLRMPGHAILRAVLPMALGLALVPRRGAGSVMGVGAIATASVFNLAGWGEKGLGSMTSLCLIGPCLDVAVHSIKSGRWVYVALVAAGVLTNLSAMAVQGVAKYLALTAIAGTGGGGGGGMGGGQNLATWWPVSLLTYPLFGAAAGLLSALVWFRWNSDSRGDSESQAS